MKGPRAPRFDVPGVGPSLCPLSLNVLDSDSLGQRNKGLLCSTLRHFYFACLSRRSHRSQYPVLKVRPRRSARPVGPAGRGAGMKYTRPGGRPQGGGGVSTGRTQLGRFDALSKSLPIACKANTAHVSSQRNTNVYQHFWALIQRRIHVQDVRYRIKSLGQQDGNPYRTIWI